MLAESNLDKGSRFLGQSVKGLVWKLDEVDQRLVTNLVQKLDIPEILATILCHRNIKTAEDAKSFLDPKLRDLMPNPFDLLDMDKAAERMAQAVINNEKITIYGDYDVDGATSTALLRRFFKSIGYEVGVYIPNRLTEGYGPNENAFRKLKEEKNSLIITVDCGIVSYEPIKLANELGMEVIILDHHLSAETLPEAYAIVNPNRIDEKFPFKTLAAVAIAFLTAVAIRAKLKEKNYFKVDQEVDLLCLLDLVALGTVCDVMSLTGVNRAFVTQGLKLIRARKNVGLAMLANVAKLEATPQSYHLGFVLGPRINAGGRVGEGLIGSDLLSTDDPNVAQNLALHLEKLNEERRAIEIDIISEALSQVESEKLYLKPVILVRGAEWHQGILGILASRLKERYHKPALVISVTKGIGKGSARSITGINLGTLISDAKAEDLLIQGGGHAMAGGFSINENRIEQFYEFVCKRYENMEHIFEKALEYSIDAILSIGAINGNLARTINRAQPFGNGNLQPRFALLNVTIRSVRVVGKAHLLIIIADEKSPPDFNNTLKCMLFKGLGHESGELIKRSIGKCLNLIGTLQLNFNDPNKADFIIEDIIIP